MELLAAILLAVWLVGIAFTVTQMVLFFKYGEGELRDRLQEGMEQAPVLLTAIMTVLIVFWPATLAYSIATKGK